MISERNQRPEPARALQIPEAHPVATLRPPAASQAPTASVGTPDAGPRLDPTPCDCPVGQPVGSVDSKALITAGAGALTPISVPPSVNRLPPGGEFRLGSDKCYPTEYNPRKGVCGGADNPSFALPCYPRWQSIPPLAAFVVEEKGWLGVDMSYQAFSMADIMTLNSLLKVFPHYRNLVEVGTFTGVTSLFLGMVARARGGFLVTYDIDEQYQPQFVRRAWLPEMEFRKANMEDASDNDACKEQKEWTEAHHNACKPTPSMVGESAVFRSAHFVFFDGGNKEKEVWMWARYIPVGGSFAIHDMGVDAMNVDGSTGGKWQYQTNRLIPFAKAYGFVEMFNDFRSAYGSAVRFFHRVSAGSKGSE